MRKFFISIGLLIAAVAGFQAPAEAQVGVQTRVDLQSDPNYRWHNGQWWYAVPNRQWLMWNGNAWVGAGAGNRYAGPNGRYYYAPGYNGNGYYGPQRYSTGYRGYGNNGYYYNRGANVGAGIGGAIGGQRGANLGAIIGGAIDD